MFFLIENNISFSLYFCRKYKGKQRQHEQRSKVVKHVFRLLVRFSLEFRAKNTEKSFGGNSMMPLMKEVGCRFAFQAALTRY